MEILVKIESGHKPKSTNILPKTLHTIALPLKAVWGNPSGFFGRGSDKNCL